MTTKMKLLATLAFAGLTTAFSCRAGQTCQPTEEGSQVYKVIKSPGSTLTQVFASMAPSTYMGGTMDENCDDFAEAAIRIGRLDLARAFFEGYRDYLIQLNYSANSISYLSTEAANRYCTKSVATGTLEITRYFEGVGGQFIPSENPLYEGFVVSFPIPGGLAQGRPYRNKQQSLAGNYSANDLMRLLATGEISATKLDEGKGSLLSYAAAFNNAEAVKTLLDAGAKAVINIADVDGRTPIFYAAIYNSDPKVIETLLQAGADVQLIDYPNHRARQATLLEVYTSKNPSFSAKMLKTLADAGTPYDVPNNQESSPLLDRAICRGDTEAITYLLDHGATITNRALKTAIQGCGAPRNADVNNRAKIIDLLISRGSDPNTSFQETREAYTPLGLAILEYNYPEIISTLIRNGSDINGMSTLFIDNPDLEKFYGSNSVTPLMLAARQCNPTTVEMLLQARAKKRLKNNRGLKAYDYILSCGDNTDRLKSLLK